VCDAPLPTCPLRVHSPTALLPSFGQSLLSDRHVPPPWFRTTSTVYSAHRLRAYCIPKPDGVRCVSELCPHLSPTEVDDRWETVTLSRNAVHTLQRIPLAGSRTASLRPLPSCCSVASRPFPAPKCPARSLARQQVAVTFTSLTAEAARASLPRRRYAHPHWPLPPPKRWVEPATLCLPAPPKGPWPVDSPDAEAPDVKLVSHPSRNCDDPRVSPHNATCLFLRRL